MAKNSAPRPGSSPRRRSTTRQSTSRPHAKAAAAATVSVRPSGWFDLDVAFADGVSQPCQVMVPRGEPPTSGWPVMLFLHGAGERGNDGRLQTEVGLGTALRRFATRYPAVVVMPQVPLGERWVGRAGDGAMLALGHVLANFPTDPARVYLTGLSMGGEGAWYLASRQPARFAALLVVCGFVARRVDGQSFVDRDGASGSVYDQLAASLRGLPTWIVHGEADLAVSVTESRDMAEALEALGSPVTYSELPGVGHNAWDAAYQSEAIVGWLFAQHRRAAAPGPIAAVQPNRSRKNSRTAGRSPRKTTRSARRPS